MAKAANTPSSPHFIALRIEEDLRKKPDLQLRLRFPPEPNGHLHLGHAKALLINFELAKKYGGKCHVRFDDTDPSKESKAYVNSILLDTKWLGYKNTPITYTSDYFEQLYTYALTIIRAGKAYIDGQNREDFAKYYKGTPTQAGKNSPDRNRSIKENIQLFTAMREGKYPPGTFTLRAKIDMSAPNMHMRDPALYRIKKAHHFRTNYQWPIYPTYDFAHCLSDAIEGITHSLCSLEFEVHRPLYEWILSTLSITGPTQIEFARLHISHTILSKRKMHTLITQKAVSDWHDPRLLTLSGMRRRGYNPHALRQFIERVGTSKRKSLTDIALLEWALREECNATSLRRMAVLRPLKIIITNYPADKEEELTAQNNPENLAAGHRMLPFSRELYIAQEDFCEAPPANFFRLAPTREVRLKHAYIIRCEEVVRNSNGQLAYIACSYDPNTRSGTPGAKRKVKGTLGWVSCKHAFSAEIRQYKPLFLSEDPESDKNYLQHINPMAMECIHNARLEPLLRQAKVGEVYQFERIGYYCRDNDVANIFHQSTSLKHSFSA